jgi:endonuclease/exonuclease/phosphatase (EEP) superfamily protein YafD
LAPVIVLGCAIAYLIKLALGDSIGWFKFVFYLPAPLLTSLGIVAVLTSGVFRWRSRTAFTVLFLLLGAAALRIDHPALWSEPGATEELADFRVMTFNVMAYNLGEARVFKLIEDQNPDVLVLLEGSFGGRSPERLVKALGPDYRWAIGRQVAIATRLDLIDSRMMLSTRETKAFEVRVQVAGAEVAIVGVDMMGPVSRRDREGFETLAALMASLDGNLIVAGDFNVPRGSRWLGAAMGDFRDDFLRAGTQRWQASWPMPIPLWQIDHSFSKGRVNPVRATLIHNLVSDHAALVVDYRLGSEVASSP